MTNTDTLTEEILKTYKTIAVVGLSPKTDRASHEVAKYMQDRGFKIIPVRPGIDEILGEKAYASLKDIPHPVDIVDIFRKPEHIGAVVDEAIEIKAKVVWMQLGLTHPEAAKKAQAAGLKVVEDKCLVIEHRRIH